MTKKRRLVVEQDMLQPINSYLDICHVTKNKFVSEFFVIALVPIFFVRCLVIKFKNLIYMFFGSMLVFLSHLIFFRQVELLIT